MKRFFNWTLFSMLCVGAMLTGCSDDEGGTARPAAGTPISFSLTSSGTRTIYDGTDPNQINWVEGDQIKIFCAEAETAKSALYNVTPASTAKDGTIAAVGSDVLQWGGDTETHHFYATYPGAANGVTVDANGNASYVDLANGHTLTLTAFLPPMSETHAAAMKRQVKVRVHITGNAELTASIKTNDASSDSWTTQFKPSAKKKITLPAIPSGQQSSGNNWITPLDGSIYVSQMSIPGSHDAATGENMATIIGDAFAQTQENTLQVQWNLGIRCFDLRPAIYKATFGSTHELWLYHGVTRVSISWATAMNTIKANLTDHPGEFAIVLFRHEDESTIGKDNNTTNFNAYMTSWVNANKSWIVNWRPDITIDECRGKLILISRFSGSWDYGCFTGWSHDEAGSTTTVKNASGLASGTMYVQDYYNPSSHDAKFSSITKYLDIAQQFHTNDAMKNHWMLNHISGYVGASTSNTYRANAAAQNPKVIEYLHNRTTPGSTGILLFDYSGAATSGSYKVQGDVMLQTVIDNNYKYRMKRKGE